MLDYKNYGLKNPEGTYSGGVKTLSKGNSMSPALIAMLPSILSFLGGLTDTSKKDTLGLSKDYLAENKRQFGVTSGLETGSFLSRLLEQKNKLQGQNSVTQGFQAGTGMGGA